MANEIATTAGKAMSVSYKALDGTDVSMDKDFVQRYVLTGNGHATDAEMMGFLAICKARGINPLVKGEAYLIKYGDSQPAATIVGIDYTMRVMDMQEQYDGYEGGVIVKHADGTVDKVEGCYVDGADRLVGGWCDIYRKDRSRPIRHTVPFEGYNTGKSAWAKYPSTMIQKVAIQQCARKAFPAALSGLYAAEEIRDDRERQPQAPAPSPQPAPAQQPQQQPQPQQQAPRLTQEQAGDLLELCSEASQACGRPIDEVKAAVWRAVPWRGGDWGAYMQAARRAAVDFVEAHYTEEGEPEAEEVPYEP